MIGIVVDPTELSGVREVRAAILAAGMVPLLIGPVGGKLDGDLDVQRTFLTARSVEFDALLLAASPPPAADALPHTDEKAGTPDGAAPVDPRVLLMVQECYRHAKAIGGWGSAKVVLEAAGCAGGAGVVVGEDASAVLTEVTTLMTNHRVWERFPVSIS
jgi:catalase